MQLYEDLKILFHFLKERLNLLKILESRIRMTKIISNVQIKKLMRAYNPKREWSEGCVEHLRENSRQLIYFMLSEIETNMEGNKRVQPRI